MMYDVNSVATLCMNRTNYLLLSCCVCVCRERERERSSWEFFFHAPELNKVVLFSAIMQTTFVTQLRKIGYTK